MTPAMNSWHALGPVGFVFLHLQSWSVQYLRKFGFHPSALGVVLIHKGSTLKWGTEPSCWLSYRTKQPMKARQQKDATSFMVYWRCTKKRMTVVSLVGLTWFSHHFAFPTENQSCPLRGQSMPRFEVLWEFEGEQKVTGLLRTVLLQSAK